jgi:hypothetical protein
MQNNIQYSQLSNQQNIQPQDSGDMINQLPFDASIPSHNEIKIFDQLFQHKQTFFDKVLLNTKDVLFVGILFIIFSIAPIDGLIKKIIPSTNISTYILIGVKSILFMITYFILKNIYLSRKN